MLCLQVRERERIYLRDRATGRVLCELCVAEFKGREKAVVSLEAPLDVEINRAVVDASKHGPPPTAA